MLVIRRFLLTIIVAIGFVAILYIASFREDVAAGFQPKDLKAQSPASAGQKQPDHLQNLPEAPGQAIAPKLENATAKAELGRSAWKVLHTTFARYPEKPTPDEKATLKSYIYLFQRVYPCGDCAAHFGKLLEKYPPQVSSRNAAAGWGCFVHNEVNKRLEKPLFDCLKIGDFYDCGCGDDDKKKTTDTSEKAAGSP